MTYGRTRGAAGEWRSPLAAPAPGRRPVASSRYSSLLDEELLPPFGGPPTGPPRRPRQRGRGRSTYLAVLVLLSTVVLAGAALWTHTWLAGTTAPTATPTPSRGIEMATVAPNPSAVISGDPTAPGGSAPVVPARGPGTFGYSTTTGEVRGSGGSLRQYQVAVEDSVGQDAEAFAGTVDVILGDPKGWTAGGALRLQRVAKGASANFTIFLASAGTSQAMCAAGGLRTNGYTSCRLSGRVIINLTRWLTAIPNYGAPLEVYQQYAVTHEVGHELGYGHEGCPGAGKLAPVMMQQTLGLQGCKANPWPYVDGKRYSGPSVS